MSLTLDGTTGISATGNITGNNVIASGTLTAGTFSPTNLIASGNITASFFIGNGSQLTGIDATQIQSGNSNVRVVSSNGNVSVAVAGSHEWSAQNRACHGGSVCAADDQF